LAISNIKYYASIQISAIDPLKGTTFR